MSAYIPSSCIDNHSGPAVVTELRLRVKVSLNRRLLVACVPHFQGRLQDNICLGVAVAKESHVRILVDITLDNIEFLLWLALCLLIFMVVQTIPWQTTFALTIIGSVLALHTGVLLNCEAAEVSVRILTRDAVIVHCFALTFPVGETLLRLVFGINQPFVVGVADAAYHGEASATNRLSGGREFYASLNNHIFARFGVGSLDHALNVALELIISGFPLAGLVGEVGGGHPLLV